MQGHDARERTTPAARDGEASQVAVEEDRDGSQLDRGGGLRYQQAHREPGAAQQGDTATAGTRTAHARESADPDQTQRGQEQAGPGREDEAWLGEQGYPKLGKSIQSRVTQVEHGPYAGGTQQGDTTKDIPKNRS